ncbi:hypothetical protein QR680_000004 [Steinernema hermaphroditum]|uniref:RRM domain-containing protein n=1 Tax=Steinernema hermaphroditum TaxID=289476 RepID=A0AA39GSW2_9BILA|nr:hypothetical protein QR680_000004 [Steinernema hermaphroditum]
MCGIIFRVTRDVKVAIAIHTRRVCIPRLPVLISLTLHQEVSISFQHNTEKQLYTRPMSTDNLPGGCAASTAPYHPPNSAGTHHQGLQGVYVENLPPETQLSNQGLREQLLSLFKKFGKPIDISLTSVSDERRALILLQKVYDMDKMLSESNQFMLHNNKMEVRLAETMAVMEAHNAYLVMTSAKASSTNMGGLQGAHFGTNNSSCDSKGMSFPNMPNSSNSSPSTIVIDILHMRATRTLYVGSLERRTTDERLRELFGRFGRILDIDVKNFDSPMPFAFIQFADIQSVARALEAYGVGGHTPNIHGDQSSSKLKIKTNWGRPIVTNKLWIGSLPNCTHEHLSSKLRVVFPDTVTEVIFDERVHEAIVVFSSNDNAQTALNRIKNRQFALLSENDKEVVHVPVDFCSEKLCDYFCERKLRSTAQANSLSLGTEAKVNELNILDPPPDPPHHLKEHLRKPGDASSPELHKRRARIGKECLHDSSHEDNDKTLNTASKASFAISSEDQTNLQKSSIHQCHSSPCGSASCRDGRQQPLSKTVSNGGPSASTEETDGHSSDTSVTSASTFCSAASTTQSPGASERVSQLCVSQLKSPGDSTNSGVARSESPLCPPPPAPTHFDYSDHRRMESNVHLSNSNAHEHHFASQRSRSRWPFSELLKATLTFPQDCRGSLLDPRLNRSSHPVPYSLPLPTSASQYCVLATPNTSSTLVPLGSERDGHTQPTSETRAVAKHEQTKHVNSRDGAPPSPIVCDETDIANGQPISNRSETQLAKVAPDEIRDGKLLDFEFNDLQDYEQARSFRNDESDFDQTVIELQKAGLSPGTVATLAAMLNKNEADGMSSPRSNGADESTAVSNMMSPRPSSPDSHPDIYASVVPQSANCNVSSFALRLNELGMRFKKAEESFPKQRRSIEEYARNMTSPAHLGTRRGSSFEQELERIRNRTLSHSGPQTPLVVTATANAFQIAAGTPSSSSDSLAINTSVPLTNVNIRCSKMLSSPPSTRSSFSTTEQNSQSLDFISDTALQPQTPSDPYPESKTPFMPREPSPPPPGPPPDDTEMPILHPLVPLLSAVKKKAKEKERDSEKDKESDKEKEKPKEREREKEKKIHERNSSIHKTSTKLSSELKLSSIDELFTDPIPLKKVKSDRKPSCHTEDGHSRKESSTSISKQHQTHNGEPRSDYISKALKTKAASQSSLKDVSKRKEKEKEKDKHSHQRVVEEKKQPQQKKVPVQLKKPLKPKKKRAPSTDSSEDDHPTKGRKKPTISSNDESDDSDAPVQTKFEKEMQKYFLEEMASGSLGLSMYDRVKRRSSAPKTDEAKTRNKTLEILREKTNKRKREKTARRVHVLSSDDDEDRLISLRNDSDTGSSITTSSRKSKKEEKQIQKSQKEKRHHSDSDDWELSQSESTRRAMKKSFVLSSSNESEDHEARTNDQRNKKKNSKPKPDENDICARVKTVEKEKLKEKDRRHREKEKDSHQKEKSKEIEMPRKRPASVLSNSSQEDNESGLAKTSKKIKHEEVKKPKTSSFSGFSMFPDLDRREEQLAAARLAKNRQKESRQNYQRAMESSETKKRLHDAGGEKHPKRIKTESTEAQLALPLEEAPKHVTIKAEMIEIVENGAVPALPKTPMTLTPLEVKTEPCEETGKEPSFPSESSLTSPSSKKDALSNRTSPSIYKSASSSPTALSLATLNDAASEFVEEIASGTVPMKELDTQSEVIEHGYIIDALQPNAHAGSEMIAPEAPQYQNIHEPKDCASDERENNEDNEDEDDDLDKEAADAERVILEILGAPKVPEDDVHSFSFPSALENVEETENAVQSISILDLPTNESDEEDSFRSTRSISETTARTIGSSTAAAPEDNAELEKSAQEGEDEGRRNNAESDIPVQKECEDCSVDKQIKNDHDIASENAFAHMDEVINNIAHGNANIEDAVLLKTGKGKKSYESYNSQCSLNLKGTQQLQNIAPVQITSCSTNLPESPVSQPSISVQSPTLPSANHHQDPDGSMTVVQATPAEIFVIQPTVVQTAEVTSVSSDALPGNLVVSTIHSEQPSLIQSVPVPQTDEPHNAHATSILTPETQVPEACSRQMIQLHSEPSTISEDAKIPDVSPSNVKLESQIDLKLEANNLESVSDKHDIATNELKRSFSVSISGCETGSNQLQCQWTREAGLVGNCWTVNLTICIASFNEAITYQSQLCLAINRRGRGINERIVFGIWTYQFHLSVNDWSECFLYYKCSEHSRSAHLVEYDSLVAFLFELQCAKSHFFGKFGATRLSAADTTLQTAVPISSTQVTHVEEYNRTEANTAQQNKQIVGLPVRHNQIPEVQQLMEKHPFLWQGNLVMKSHSAMVRMQFVAGDPSVLERCKVELMEKSETVIRIGQRMRMNANQIEGVYRKMKYGDDYLALLCHPCGTDRNQVNEQTNFLLNSFIGYFQNKEAAGIVKKGTAARYMMHMFPPGEFASSQLRLYAPEILDFSSQIDGKFMYVLITTSAIPDDPNAPPADPVIAPATNLISLSTSTSNAVNVDSLCT